MGLKVIGHKDMTDLTDQRQQVKQASSFQHGSPQKQRTKSCVSVQRCSTDTQLTE